MSGVDPKQEALFMPSSWVKRVAATEAVPLHVQITRRESQLARGANNARLGVQFGPDRGDKLDIFNPEGNSGFIVVYISGGYWQELFGEISAYTVRPLVAAGHTAIVVHYDRAPAQDMAGIVGQVERAGRWILNYAREEGRRVWLTGHSAGAQLCNMLITSTWINQYQEVLAGVIYFSGVYYLKPLLKTSVNTPLKMDEKDADYFSPGSESRLALAGQLANVEHHLLVGEHDPPPFLEQAHTFRKCLEVTGCKTSLTILKDEDHFSIVEKMADLETEPTRIVLSLIK